MTRRKGIIKALAVAMAALAGRKVHAQQANGLASTAVVSIKRSLALYLDDLDGIYVHLKDERIHITPEEIMEFLREPEK